ncbi:efflux RND transporter permease subunit [Tautonia sociabilis]|uniref:Efflux RND transporter permease subunit n=1 Tax=Tautonia sociabilis TaxID=2080755 RepID=A0A432MK58_9BACT|nr:efflux RND transporter permease subunit [Tautonia sociabilis]RUL87793.1 efflux RND transporter permease subunit [Tautonia sociabilis]
MRSIVQWVVRNGPAVNTLMVAVVLVGVVSLLGLKKELFPEFQLEIVTVSVPYPGASPAEVEEGICQKIEEAVRAVDGIKKITSVASEGMGSVTIELRSNVGDPQKVLNEIRSEVDQIPSFPLLAEDPDVKLLSFREPAIRVAVIGGGRMPEGLDDTARREWQLREDLQLRDLAERVRDDLLELPSVSLVEMLAVRDYQIDVEIPEETLRRHNLSLQQVGAVIRRENIELPAGEIKARSSEYLVRGKNKRLTGDEIALLPLLTRPDGAVLRVEDLGTVHDGFTDDARRSWVRFPEPLADPEVGPATGQGEQSAIVLMVQKTRAEDLIEIVGEVRDFVKGLELPPGYRAEVFDDQSILVRERLETLTLNALQGLALVFVVLALFLDLRLAFWVAMGIPVAIGGSFIVMGTADVTLNMVSTFAFLLALGIVVDDAIVVGENIYRHREMGKSPVRAAIDGATEVSGPVLASVTTTIFAFLPMFFVSGTLGKVIYIMPIVVCSMLLSSLGESILILPNHLSHRRAPILSLVGRLLCWLLTPLFLWVWVVRALRDRRAEARSKWRGNPVVTAYHGLRSGVDGGLRWVIESVYEPALKTALRAPVALVSAMLAVLIGSFGLVASGLVPFVVFPDFDSNYITANVTFPAGTPASVTEEATRRIADQIEALHAEIAERTGRPPVRTISRSIGYAETAGGGPGASMSTTGSNIGMVFAEMVGGQDRPISSFELVNRWRERCLPLVQGFDELKFGAGNTGPGGKPIEFQLTGKDMDDLEEVVERCKARLSEYEGVFDIADNSKPGKPEIQLRVKPSAEALGIDTNELAQTVRSTFYGEEVMRLQRGRHEVKLMVRYPPEQRGSLANLREIRIRTPEAGEVPIEELAAVEVRRGYSAINRIDQQRSITVTADVDEAVANAREITQDLQTAFLPALLEEFPGIRVRWEGQERETQESFGSLVVGFVVALFAMFVLLTAQFRSYLQPLFILIIVPFGLVGAIWGHLLMGLPLTLFSVFGLVALAGVIVNDSIVLIDFINSNVAEGKAVRLALREAGKQRFRPVLLTSLTTVAALIPLLLEKSLQVQVLIPMATSLAFGLSFGTLLVLFLVPCLYAIYADVLDAFGRPVTADHHIEDEIPLSEPYERDRHSGLDADTGRDRAGAPGHHAPAPTREPVHAAPDHPVRSGGA